MKPGWEMKKLGDVCRFEKVQGDFDDLPYVGLEHIEPSTARFVGTYEPQSVKSATFHFSEGHVLYGRLRPYLKKVLAPNFCGHCSTEIFPIRPLSCVLREYLLFWLLSDETSKLINATSTGTRMPRADMNTVMELTFPLPPLPEQQRIVGILDEAFENIALATVNAETNLKNADALFESHLNDIFSKREEMWAMMKLGEIADVQSGGTPAVSRKEYWDGSIAWYSSGELNETFTSQPERTISESGINSSNAKLFPKGSLLVGMYDTAALKMSILDREAAFNQAIAGVWPNPETDMAFVRYAIQAIKPKLLLERRGVRQKNLSLGKIREIVIPFPPIIEQHRVADQIEKVAVETQRLASIYHRKLAALDELKKSLLHQAFTGQL